MINKRRKETNKLLHKGAIQSEIRENIHLKRFHLAAEGSPPIPPPFLPLSAHIIRNKS